MLITSETITFTAASKLVVDQTAVHRGRAKLTHKIKHRMGNLYIESGTLYLSAYRSDDRNFFKVRVRVSARLSQ